ncbi:MAG TPA: alpha/beta hydrolase [Solirubrobacteraceae bacterium]|nr:alpha/beta hydrolase [Solirubrobacteraceae bacterium]
MGQPQERPDEIRALSRLAAAELAGGADGISSVHDAIARRVFDSLGTRVQPVRLAHDAIARGVYASVRGAATTAGHVADQTLGRREPGDGRPLSAAPRSAVALAVVNGLIGDALEREGSDLHQPMGLRVRGRVVEPEPEALAGAFPRATPRLVVFVHGLMGTEHAWRLGGGTRYGARLARDLGCTPLDVRYNSGRHISRNGRSFADLLEATVAGWPVEVDQIALVGHSMGGLVARSACRQASEHGHDWVRRVRHVVSLGTPHMGAPLAQGVHYAAHALQAIPETRAFARFLRRRSAGIRDLRDGSLVDRDWEGSDPDALRAAACAEVPLLEGATHCFVAATLTRSPNHPLGRLLGDALVLSPSASGRSRKRRIPFRAEHGMHLGGAHHLALLNHPDVYAKLREWLAQPSSQALRPPSSLHSTGKKASSSSRSPGRR